jgi:hypothetical protein
VYNCIQLTWLYVLLVLTYLDAVYLLRDDVYDNIDGCADVRTGSVSMYHGLTAQVAIEYTDTCNAL